jgi:uncharacterized protein with NRDE domain
LVRDFLAGDRTPAEHLADLAAKTQLYAGFNLVVGDPRETWWFSNRGAGPRRLEAGIHGLSNHLLDTPWPKVSAGMAGLRHLAAGASALDPQALLRLLASRRRPPDAHLPATGVGLAWERILAPIFVRSTHYGTRCSSVILWEWSGRLEFIERTHPAAGPPSAAGTRRIVLASPPPERRGP